MTAAVPALVNAMPLNVEAAFEVEVVLAEALVVPDALVPVETGLATVVPNPLVEDADTGVLNNIDRHISGHESLFCYTYVLTLQMLCSRWSLKPLRPMSMRQLRQKKLLLSRNCR